MPETFTGRCLGLDFGFVNDPTAIVDIRMEGWDLFVDLLCYEQGLLNSHIADYLNDNALNRVITVCDSAAGEICPLSFNGVRTEHWSLPDPSKIEDKAEQDALFRTVIERIQAQVPIWKQMLTGQ